jgi:hypothetical protein
MADLKTFARRIRKIGQNIEKNADVAVRTCGLAVDAAVVIATPVDTGRARGNWQVTLDTPASGTTPALSVSGNEALEQGKSVIAGYKGGRPQAAIHITNNLPYIGKLNEGHSAQAPAGFVERAILVGIQAIKNMKFTAVRTSGE